ncbi:HPP family protein [Thiomicrorhabdus aquaedulcis]|uniref:CBS domain-containing protein n=1 Tax=Thiomicrorhabdus aquaedulcis TaxID=2211106 RepID=UPI000FDA568D|nr:CBS domain-containing protein [Thiomicrorhabdus aquaedulcis]
MFIVYSPEGQRIIGASLIPPLKVDPASRINPVEQAGFGAVNVEEHERENPAKRAQSPLNAYELMQKQEQGRRLVVKVADIMSYPVIHVSSEWTIEQAWLLMQQHKIKHLPVLMHDRLVGICSQDDLLARIILSKKGDIEGVKAEQVADVMHANVITTVPETDIRRVAQVFDDYSIGALLVMSTQGVMLGIVTKMDLIHRLSQEPPLELYV